MDGTESETGIQSPTSEGSTKDGSLIIAPIQVIIPFDGSSDEDSDREEEQKRQVRQKKKKTSSKSKQKQNNEPKADKTAMLTKTFGQAIRLINESKVFLVFQNTGCPNKFGISLEMFASEASYIY